MFVFVFVFIQVGTKDARLQKRAQGTDHPLTAAPAAPTHPSLASIQRSVAVVATKTTTAHQVETTAVGSSTSCSDTGFNEPILHG